ncbi:MAG TPA: hypothetical protein VFD43_13430, partial [Planctomycetota bacterium]|nr:hypothetical protein [Planctomycetota bacterium]
MSKRFAPVVRPHVPLSAWLLVLPALFATDAAAQTTWIGTTDSSWNEASNWDKGVPTSTESVVIAPATNQPSTFTTNPVCLDLTIDVGATLMLSDGFDLTVGGSLTINGSLVVASSSSTIAVNGAVTVAAGGYFDIGTSTHTVGNNWDSSAATAVVDGSGTIEFVNVWYGTTTTNLTTGALPNAKVSSGGFFRW